MAPYALPAGVDRKKILDPGGVDRMERLCRVMLRPQYVLNAEGR